MQDELQTHDFYTKILCRKSHNTVKNGRIKTPQPYIDFYISLEEFLPKFQTRIPRTGCVVCLKCQPFKMKKKNK